MKLSNKFINLFEYDEKKVLYKGAVITLWSDDGKNWGTKAFNKKTRKEIFSGGLANFDSYQDALDDAKQGVDEFINDFGGMDESDADSIMDLLSNVEEVTVDDLVDIGLDKNKAKNLLDAWWNLSAMDRHNLSMNDSKFEKWVKGNI